MSTPSTPAPEPEEAGDEGGRRDFDEEFARIVDAEGIAPRPEIRSAPTPESADAPEDPAAPEDPEDPEDEVLLGDFEPPDPDLPQASDYAVWSWTALIGGVLLALLAAVLDSIPTWAGALGGIAAVGGLVALIARVPPDRSDPTDGAQV
ncbi:hypothetical protein [Brachybacterium sp. ACRRE]|uniref:hypothetical protein n=1 Tax=Brachybacterium sp. ACRRE TaxID=2918184 RepID=UPI001EF26EAD|nr:hypothetical protein [Brachybacterium sp. ACRRE]MCG7308973.1 hypothetical protein [Brachybacterium sp. ACRRE]